MLPNHWIFITFGRFHFNICFFFFLRIFLLRLGCNVLFVWFLLLINLLLLLGMIFIAMKQNKNHRINKQTNQRSDAHTNWAIKSFNLNDTKLPSQLFFKVFTNYDMTFKTNWLHWNLNIMILLFLWLNSVTSIGLIGRAQNKMKQTQKRDDEEGQ